MSSGTCAAGSTRSNATKRRIGVSRRAGPDRGTCRRRHRPGGHRRGGAGARRRRASASATAFSFEPALLGGAAIDATGEALPAATLDLCRRATRSCWARSADRSGRIRTPRCGPNRACCSCARRSDCSPTCGPWCRIPRVLDASPIKPELLHGVDIMVVRELTGGIYFGDKQRTATEAVRPLPLYASPRSSASCASRPRSRAARRRKLDLGRQGQRAGDLAAVALGGRAHHAGGISRRRARAHAGRCGRDAPDPAAARLRRDRHREHVRRHPHRRGLDAGRFAGHAALRLARRTAPRRPVRAHPRLRAGHRRPRHRQSVCDDPERGACCCATRCSSTPRPWRSRPRFRRPWSAGALPGRSRRRRATPSRPRAAGDAVLAALAACGAAVRRRRCVARFSAASRSAPGPPILDARPTPAAVPARCRRAAAQPRPCRHGSCWPDGRSGSRPRPAIPRA